MDNWGPDVQVKVYPCCVEEAVLRTGVPRGPWRFVFVGGTAPWQCLDLILDYHLKLTKLIPDAELKIFTPDEGQMRQFVSKHGVTATIENVPHEQIVTRMAECDFGYLFRKDIVLNQVASPVKFLEYVSNGVIPIISDGIGDYSADVKELKFGVLVSPDGVNLAEDINRMEALLREETYQRLFSYSIGFLWRNQSF